MQEPIEPQAAMEPKFNLWIEVEGEVALSAWRIGLLQAVAETGSINSAADKLNIQYRTAWQKIHEMEVRLGQKLLDTQTGGVHGGGAHLTAVGQAYVDKLVRLQALLAPIVEAKYREVFGAPPAQPH
jgi:molybdate transport system regulatory protein